MPLWRGDHVPVRQLVEDFASYLYLPRLLDPAVLLRAVADGVGLLTWSDETFGYADSVDEEAGRYRGLRGGQPISVPDVDAAGVLVKPDVARLQLTRSRRRWLYHAGWVATGPAIPERCRNLDCRPCRGPTRGRRDSTETCHSMRAAPGATRVGSPTR